MSTPTENSAHTSRLYHLEITRKSAPNKRLTGYAMPHAECVTMKSKFSNAEQAKILFVEELSHAQKLAVMREASASQRASRETEFAQIDEAIATHRAAMPVDPDHGPIGNHESEARLEIDLLRAEVTRLNLENEKLKIKLSRMCGDA